MYIIVHGEPLPGHGSAEEKAFKYHADTPVSWGGVEGKGDIGLRPNVRQVYVQDNLLNFDLD